MQFKNDNRGVSEVIGAILVFGLLIALMAIIQTQAVPAANQEVEFDHNQQVQGDLVKFHETASEVIESGESESVRVEAGTGYPTRMLFFNPPRVSGKVATSEAREVHIVNAESNAPEVDDYFDGDDQSLDSRTLSYEPQYNELRNSPTTRYEYGVLYNDFGDEVTYKNRGAVVDGKEINLFFMAGDYSHTSGGIESLNLRPVSAPARSVPITGEDDDDIEIELPTRILDKDEWSELVDEEGNENVLDVSVDKDDETVTIKLDGSKTYSLRMAQLGLESGVERPDPHYIVPTDAGITSVGSGQETNVAFEVRDEYNAPVSGVEVSIDGLDETFETGSDGKIVVPGSFDGTTDVTATVTDDRCDDDERCSADYRVQVSDFEVNPASGTVLESVTIETDIIDALSEFIGGILPITGGASAESAVLNFDSTDQVQFSQVRINYYQSDGGSPPEMWSMAEQGEDDEDNIIRGEVSGPFVSAEALPEFSGDQEFMVTFDDGDDTVNVQPGDFFVITIIDEDGQRAMYFASPN